MSKYAFKEVLLSTCLVLTSAYLAPASAGKSGGIGGVSALGGSANGGDVHQSQSNSFSNGSGEKDDGGASPLGGSSGGMFGGGGGNAIASGNNAQIGIGGDGGKGGDGGVAVGGGFGSVSANGGSANGGSVGQSQHNSFSNDGGDSILSGNNAQVGVGGDGGYGGKGGKALGLHGRHHKVWMTQKGNSGKTYSSSPGRKKSGVFANGGDANGGSVWQSQSNSFSDTGGSGSWKGPWDSIPAGTSLSETGGQYGGKYGKSGGKAFASGNNLQFGKGGKGGHGGQGGFAFGSGGGIVSANGGDANGGSVSQSQSNSFKNKGGKSWPKGGMSWPPTGTVPIEVLSETGNNGPTGSNSWMSGGKAIASGNNLQLGVGGKGGHGGDGGLAIGGGPGGGIVSANGGSANGGSVHQRQHNSFDNDGLALLSGNNAQIGVGGQGGYGGDGGIAIGSPGYGGHDKHHHTHKPGEPSSPPTTGDMGSIVGMMDGKQRLNLFRRCADVLDNPTSYRESVRDVCVFVSQNQETDN